MEIYSHRQTNGLMLIVVSLAAIFAIGAVWFAPGEVSWPAIVALILGLVLVRQFTSLTVVVTESGVETKFGSGVIRVKISTSNIKSVRVVRNSWILGWGIRLVPGGWMFNLAGFDAVELELLSGRLFRIGTDEPQQLEAALLQARSLAGR